MAALRRHILTEAKEKLGMSFGQCVKAIASGGRRGWGWVGSGANHHVQVVSLGPTLVVRSAERA
jgi:hypothetical protein